MFCTKCGKKLSGAVDKCPYCGNGLKDGMIQDGGKDNTGGYTRKYCPYCGTHVPGGSLYCGKCGKKMMSEEAYVNLQGGIRKTAKENDSLLRYSVKLKGLIAGWVSQRLLSVGKTVKVMGLVASVAVIVLFVNRVMDNNGRNTGTESQDELTRQLENEEKGTGEKELTVTQTDETEGMEAADIQTNQIGGMEKQEVQPEEEDLERQQDVFISEEMQSIKINGNYIYSISASSELEDATKTYRIEDAFDGDKDTCWCEGTDGAGEGEYMEIQFKSPLYLTEIDFLNGYMKNEDVFNANGKIKRVGFLFSDGNSYETSLKKAEYKDVKNMSYSDSIVFDVPMWTESLRITILEAEAGAKYDDTCLTELAIWGYNGGAAQTAQDAEGQMAQGNEEGIHIDNFISGTYGCYMGEDMGAEITLTYDEENKSLYIEGNCWAGMNVGMIEKGTVSGWLQDKEALLYDDGYGNRIYIYLLDNGEIDVKQEGEFGGIGTTFEGAYERISW